MLESFQALLVTFMALLPGALYVWAFERQAGRYGIGLSDRLLRFVGGSGVFLALFAIPLYWLWAQYWDRLARGESVPLWLGLVLPTYVLLPMAAGTLVGLGLRRGWKVSDVLSGPDRAPRAWDHLFQYRIHGWVRCRMKSGTWLAGAYADASGRKAYAAGYPEPQDLYLAASVPVHSETGEFLLDEAGRPQLGTGGLGVTLGGGGTP